MKPRFNPPNGVNDTFHAKVQQDWKASCDSISQDQLLVLLQELKESPAKILEVQQYLQAFGLHTFRANDMKSTDLTRDVGVLLSAFAVICRMTREQK
jgi:hypothetical protein